MKLENATRHFPTYPSTHCDLKSPHCTTLEGSGRLIGDEGEGGRVSSQKSSVRVGRSSVNVMLLPSSWPIEPDSTFCTPEDPAPPSDRFLGGDRPLSGEALRLR